jgi:CheY-like chemotaxis protein
VDSGIAAIVAARENQFDVIFVDTQLRDVPGHEAIRWLRSSSAPQSTPIVVLNAEADDGADLAFTRQNPALRKPVSVAAIRRTIHELPNSLVMLRPIVGSYFNDSKTASPYSYGPRD